MGSDASTTGRPTRTGSTETSDEGASTGRRPGRSRHPHGRRAATVGGLAAVLALGSYGVAAASTGSSSTHRPATSASTGAPPPGGAGSFGQPGPGHRAIPMVAGTVQSDTAGSVVVKDDEGFWRTVAVTSSTKVTKGGQPSSISALATGDEVVATGTIAGDHTTLDATSLEIELPSVQGTVTAVSNGVITLKTGSSTAVTVDTTPSTAYSTPTGSGTASSVAVGDVVTVEGTKASDGVVTATEVRVGGAPGTGGLHGHWGPGGPAGAVPATGAPGSSSTARPARRPAAAA